jgi:hypothetical protein
MLPPLVNPGLSGATFQLVVYLGSDNVRKSARSAGSADSVKIQALTSRGIYAPMAASFHPSQASARGESGAHDIAHREGLCRNKKKPVDLTDRLL